MDRVDVGSGSTRPGRIELDAVKVCGLGTATSEGIVEMDKRLQVNRTNWNERTPVHAASDFYDVEGFRAGRITLKDLERREVGDVSGKTLLHLQCHFGMDTMSWARLGANSTGVDFSDAAIDLARSLNDELGLNTRFILSNVYDLPDALDELFDIVFTSYGALCWLPDLDKWAAIVHQFLKPGGVFYIAEIHPCIEVFEQSGSGDVRPAHGYFENEFFFEGNEQSYAGTDLIPSPNYAWAHSLGEIVTALIEAGLVIEFLHEFPFSVYQVFPVMEKGGDGWWRFPEHNDSFPQLFSIKATR